MDLHFVEADFRNPLRSLLMNRACAFFRWAYYKIWKDKKKCLSAFFLRRGMR